MIFFVELQMQGAKHLNVNSGMLKILKLSSKSGEIEVFADSLHSKYLEEIVSNIGIKYNVFRYNGDFELKKKFMFFKVFRESFLAFRIFRKAKKAKAEYLYFASAFPFTAIFLNFFARLFNQSIIIALHGDIGVLQLSSQKLTTKIYQYVNSFFLKNRSKNVSLLVYGESIKKNLLEQFPSFKKENIVCIDHPYNFDWVSTKNKPQKPIVIANIGTGLMNKNSHLFYQLAELLKDLVVTGDIKFVQIGNVSPEVLTYSNDLVEIVNENRFIPKELFEERISQTDYFIYFFSKGGYYDLCPSGTFFDAIKYRKPILSLDNDFFAYYFSKLGNIGYLSDNVSELAYVIRSKIVNDADHQHDNQVASLSRAQKILSIDNIAFDYKNQLSKLTWHK